MMTFCSHTQKCKRYKGFADFEQLWLEVQALKLALFKNPKFQWVHEHEDS